MDTGAFVDDDAMVYPDDDNSDDVDDSDDTFTLPEDEYTLAVLPVTETY